MIHRDGDGLCVTSAAVRLQSSQVFDDQITIRLFGTDFIDIGHVFSVNSNSQVTVVIAVLNFQFNDFDVLSFWLNVDSVVASYTEKFWNQFNTQSVSTRATVQLISRRQRVRYTACPLVLYQTSIKEIIISGTSKISAFISTRSQVNSFTFNWLWLWLWLWLWRYDSVSRCFRSCQRLSRCINVSYCCSCSFCRESRCICSVVLSCSRFVNQYSGVIFRSTR